MPLRWIVGELKTGRITGTLPLVDDSWSMVLDDAGTLSGALTLKDKAVRDLTPRAAAEPARMFMAAAWADEAGEETVLEAGPVWTHGYSGKDRSLRIGGAGVWTYYDHRKVMGVLTGSQTAATVTYQTGPTSLGTVAKNLVSLAHTHTNGSLPIVLPADVAGSETRQFPGAELAWIGGKLRELTAEEDGPEIAFVPRVKPSDETRLEWVMQTGTPAQPMLVQTGLDWVWDCTVPQSPVEDVSVEIDGTRLASRMWAAGASASSDRLIVSVDDATLTAGGWPLLEAETEGTDTVASTAQLSSIARQAAAEASLPMQTWTLSLRPSPAGPGPKTGQYRPGHWATVVIGEHDYLSRGEYRGRIVQVSGDNEGAKQVQFQPQPGTV